MPIRILEVPCRADNYAYLVWESERDEAIVVDPAAAAPVRAALSARQLKLAAILNTHHHFDHVAGNEALLAEFPGASVHGHGSDRERIPGMSAGVEHGQQLELAGMSIRVLHVPGHTLGAVAYCIDDAVFTGDTLFVAGCGRLFEGTAVQLHESLSGKLGALPLDTRVYCGHEYTLDNLRFAVTVEPDSEALRQRLSQVADCVEAGRPTVPSSIGQELRTNPFLRCHEPAVAARFGGATPVEVFAALRRAKDSF